MRATRSAPTAPHLKGIDLDRIRLANSISSPSRKIIGVIRMGEITQIVLSKNFRRAALGVRGTDVSYAMPAIGGGRS